MFRKTEPPIIQLGKKTAFFSALSMNIFFLFVQFIILIYSFSMGENVGGIIAERLSNSTFYTGQVISFVVNVFLLYIFFRIEFWILQHFSNSRRRSLLSFFALLIFVGVLSTIISQLLGIWFKGELTAYGYSIICFIKDLVLFFASVFVTYLIYLIIKNQERIEENKNLTIENIRNRYEVLKNQFNPHFLFNSLNTLDGLIGYDDERAHIYLQNLSDTFRYTIHNKKEIAELDEELKFLDAYVYLMEIRYGDNFSIHYQIDEKDRRRFVLHGSLQVLVENVIKHNVADDKRQLFISVETTGKGSIKVTNNKNPKMSEEREEKGIGLENLAERYRLLFNKEIRIKDGNDTFSVEIPLIKQMSE